MNSKLKWILPIVFILVGVGGMKFFIQFGAKAEPQPIEVIPPLVEVIHVQKSDYQALETSQGEVASQKEIDLSSEVKGRIVEVAPAMVSGGFFKTGDVLVRIDPSDYEVAVQRAEAEVAKARVNQSSQNAEATIALQEWESLGSGRGAPSDLLLRKPQLEEAEANLNAAMANLTKAKRDLERTAVRAPFNGRVRVKYADLGQFLREADKVARIYSVDAAEVRLPLPIEKTKFLDLPLDYSNEDSVGSHPILLTATFGGREFQWEAQLDRVEGEIDSRTRMIHLVARVDQPYAKDPAHPDRPPLAVGMFVQADIRGSLISNTVSLPREIMHGRDQALIVSKKGEDGTYRISFRDVEVIQRNESTVIIQDGLQTGELVCASPLSIVTSDMQVRLAENTP
jgi:RND family efflux transporter MFP subunit